MNRTIPAAHSHARSGHPAFVRPQSGVADGPSLDDEFGIRRQAATARFRGVGLEKDDEPVIFTPVFFTPPRRRLRMHRETIMALFGGIVAVLLITCSFWLMITRSQGAANGAAAPGSQREQRLFDEDTAAGKLR